MAEWWIELRGPTADLQQLSEVTALDSVRVVGREGKYFLRSDELDGISAADSRRAVATDLLQSLAQAAILQGLRVGRISVGNMTGYAQGETGTQIDQVVLLESAFGIGVAGTITRAGDPQAQPPLQLAALAKLLRDLKDQEARDIVERYCEHIDNWTHLYAIVEIIRHRMNGKIPPQWASKGQLKLFERTAQHPDSAGVTARHGRLPQAAPKKPMPLAKAQALVSKIILNWINTLV